LPARVPHIQVRTITKDSNGQGIGFAVRDFDIAPPALATLRGRLLDDSGRPVPGVPVHALYHGLRAEYFDFQTPLVAIPDLRGRSAGRIGAVTALNYRNPERVFGLDPMDSGMLPDFAARFSGFLEIRDAGKHIFFLRSQEGARLTINGERVV